MKMNIPRKVFYAILALSLAGSACRLFIPENTPETPPAPNQPSPAAQTEAPAQPAETAAVPEVDLETQAVPEFAAFKEPPIQAAGSVQSIPVEPGLANVYNPFVLSDAQIERLVQDGFVVTPGQEKEFFTVYEKARYANVPIFVTSDSLLHVYHLLFDKVLRTAEMEHFIPLLQQMNAALLAQVDQQYQQLQGGPWEDPALKSVAYVGVASRLLDPAAAVPAYADAMVGEQIKLIEDAAGISPSPVFPTLEFGEDYTQYIPRGHYTLNDQLKAYFKSMMWYGRMTFRLETRDPEAGRAETRAGLLVLQALRNIQVGSQTGLEAWADLYSPTVFFVGRSDDLTVLQYLPVIDAVYGPQASLQTLADDSQLDTFIAAAKQLPPPRILGMVISDTDDETQATQGLRFMGQRFVPDAYIFRQLIYRNVSTQEHRRGLPQGLDVMAAMGSERAYQLLDQSGQTGYDKYPAQMEKVRSWLAGLTTQEWTETLYNAWMYSFYPLIEQPGEGYPAFMQSQAWLDKQLNTSLGSWAELKHDTILYAKQVYAEMGGGPPAPEPVPPKGYVEPVPAFYARLFALTQMTREGLDSRGLLSETDRDSLAQIESLAQSFQAMAEKELQGQPLTDEEYDTIRFYGGTLEHLVMASADTEAAEPGGEVFMDEEPQAAVIADVATDPDPDGDGAPNPSVLEVGVGRVNEIHAVVPVVQADGTTRLQIAKGGVFSYYEFVWPAEDRLTDEKWRGLLDGGQAPERPAWTASFMTDQGEYAALQAAVFNTQKLTIDAYWNPAYADLTAPNLVPFQPELQALMEAVQFAGHSLVASSFTSFDQQSDTQAVVTTLETWEDTLYAGEYGGASDTPLAHRGPYELQATYTLEYQTTDYGQDWVVTGVTMNALPPTWDQ